MAAIRSEHDTQNKIIQGQKSALDGIISDLGSLRFLGKDRDTASELTSARATPAPEEVMDITESAPDAGLVAADIVQVEEKEEGEEDKVLSGPAVEELGEDDIEMGEVEEPKNDKGKKKYREELEEGEASDTSSALSDLPDD
jgi:THO complex subunit 7